ncbi:probable protein phosphatase 2C 6 isoform X3 [Ananas comosus]|uniref:protein-serine/threonine phosphatase n=1 Tax=Ananas comosus TaxID=4615 RepID=A0A6P5GBF3_ANACO|nr:probable protein phosphatase 2C 6 isoform X3 [Ananas comosus]
MEELSPAAPALFPAPLLENPMEIARLKLITDAAALLPPDPDPAPDPSPATAAAAAEDVELRSIAGSDDDDDDDDAASIGPELSAESPCSIASDSSSVAEELLNSDTPFCEIADAAAKAVGESSGDTMAIGGENDVSAPAVVEPATCRAGGGVRSVFLLDYVPLWGCTSICGRRPEMEDAVVAAPRFFDIPLRLLTSDAVDGLDPCSFRLPAHFFGVYDGHGGAQVANYCRDRIHVALVEELSSIDEGLGTDPVVDFKKQWERAFVDCFEKVDDEVGGKARRANAQSMEEDSDGIGEGPSEPVAPETVGSTAVVAVICSSHIIVANCGDSRAVLCRGKQPVPLSVDHKPNREDEYARIEAGGGKVIQWNGYRVFGVLAMSRSIVSPIRAPSPSLRQIPKTMDNSSTRSHNYSSCKGR